jgi:hypothetical protein
MIFLVCLLYAVFLWPCAWIVPALFDGDGSPIAALAALIFSSAVLVVVSWGIRTYQPELKRPFGSLGRLRGSRAVCLVCAVAIGGMLIFGEPTSMTALLAVPMCFALALNAAGWDFWPSSMRPEPAPEPAPQPPVAPPPDQTEALITREFGWIYDEIPYHISLAIRRSVYDELRSEERIPDPAAWPKTYVADGITGEVRDLATRLSRLGKPFRSYDEVSLALAFVQQVVTYTRDEGEYPRYAVETLVDEKGDCEDFAILAASVLHCMGYQAALMYVPGHAALGVAGAPGLDGIFKEHDGIRYYYCEMTGDGWQIGQLPEHH